jgi:hypothetical protein
MIRKIEEIKIPKRANGASQYKVMETLQKRLIDLYIEKKGQIPYPVDVNNTDSQKFIRELFGFINEEISESFEVLEYLTRNHPQMKADQTLEMVKEYNVEQADCMAFMIEILLYCNIEEADLYAYYTLLLNEARMPELICGDVLKMAFDYAKSIDHMAIMRNRAKFRISRSTEDYHMGAATVGHVSLVETERTLFQVMYYLGLASNKLKNKYWKEETQGVNTEEFHKLIMETWLHYILYLQMNGFTEESVYLTFYRKNQINIDRINNKY